jgi:hypothetical protein
MTTREWFRILRRSAWEGQLPHVSVMDGGVEIYLWTLTDYQAFIEQNIPTPSTERQVQRVIRRLSPPTTHFVWVYP